MLSHLFLRRPYRACFRKAVGRGIEGCIWACLDHTSKAQVRTRAGTRLGKWCVCYLPSRKHRANVEGANIGGVLACGQTHTRVSERTGGICTGVWVVNLVTWVGHLLGRRKARGGRRGPRRLAIPAGKEWAAPMILRWPQIAPDYTSCSWRYQTLSERYL